MRYFIYVTGGGLKSLASTSIASDMVSRINGCIPNRGSLPAVLC